MPATSTVKVSGKEAFTTAYQKLMNAIETSPETTSTTTVKTSTKTRSSSSTKGVKDSKDSAKQTSSSSSSTINLRATAAEKDYRGKTQLSRVMKLC